MSPPVRALETVMAGPMAAPRPSTAPSRVPLGPPDENRTPDPAPATPEPAATAFSAVSSAAATSATSSVHDDEAPCAFEATRALPPIAGAPHLSQATAPLLREITVLDPHGERRTLPIPEERPLTVYVDRRELVTLMTLGAAPELLVAGYLLNQRLIARATDIASITVDWDVEAAAVHTHGGIPDLEARTARRVVTTGCGQGTVYGDAMAQLDALCLPSARDARIRQSTLHQLLERMRARHSVHRVAGSVHGCALFDGSRLLVSAEDVGRHNAIDTIAGWMALHGVAGGDKVFYTTGRLTSEMVMKAARMGIPIVVSRNGVTAMGHELACRLGMTLFGRAANRHFLCYCGFDRFDAEPAGPLPVRVVAG